MRKLVIFLAFLSSLVLIGCNPEVREPIPEIAYTYTRPSSVTDEMLSSDYTLLNGYIYCSNYSKVMEWNMVHTENLILDEPTIVYFNKNADDKWKATLPNGEKLDWLIRYKVFIKTDKLNDYKDKKLSRAYGNYSDVKEKLDTNYLDNDVVKYNVNKDTWYLLNSSITGWIWEYSPR